MLMPIFSRATFSFLANGVKFVFFGISGFYTSVEFMSTMMFSIYEPITGKTWILGGTMSGEYWWSEVAEKPPAK